MIDTQLTLPLAKINPPVIETNASPREKLIALLRQDLDFHGQNGAYASHNFHSFPAKFPPQLPAKFINALTQPGDVVLDPMSGSGTTVLEAFLLNRRGIGFDIDPLAILVATVKTTPADANYLGTLGHNIILNAAGSVKNDRVALEKALKKRWDENTYKFVNYWFAPEAQIELLALLNEIEKIDDLAAKNFFRLAFSSIIITKSGGVSLALDLAHTRPHRAKLVYTQSGEVLTGEEWINSESARLRYVSKTLRSPIQEFGKRVQKNLQGIRNYQPGYARARVQFGNAQKLPLKENSVNLIVTSPPYASNAIDYMRAHKFSLVWLGYPINDLGERRRKYIGGETMAGITFAEIPDDTSRLVAEITALDEKKGKVLRRYYSEMTRTLREMYRVLKPGAAAIVVVGSSVMRGRDTETAVCLADIGKSLGFDVPQIGIRQLDRDKRIEFLFNNCINRANYAGCPR